MSDCCLIKKVATVEVYENKNEVRAYGFMAGDKNTPVMEVKFRHLWGEENLSKCKLRWIIVDDLGSLLVGEVPIEQDNTASIQLPNELFTGERRMKVQLTVASCDGNRILNLQQFTDLKVINNLATNEVVEPVYGLFINRMYDEYKKYLAQLETLYNSQYGSLENLYINARNSLEQYLIEAENGGNAEFLQGYTPAMFQKVESTIADLKASSKYKLGDVVEVLGFHTKGDGSHHKRIAKAEDDGSGELGQNGIWWCIVHNGEVDVSWLGARIGDYDNREVIQKALDTYTNITFDGEYRVKSFVGDNALVIRRQDGFVMKGKNERTSIIRFDLPSNIRSGLRLEDRCAYFVGENFSLEGELKVDAIFDANKYDSSDKFKPYMSLRNVRAHQGKYAFRISTYVATLDKVVAETSEVGFDLFIDSTETFSTSTTLTSCYANNCKIGFKSSYITYSNFISCATDHADIGYSFDYAYGFNMLGCGSEDTTKFLKINNRAQSFSLDNCFIVPSSEFVDSLIEINDPINVKINGICLIGDTSKISKKLKITNSGYPNTNLTITDNSIRPKDVEVVGSSSEFGDKVVKYIRNEYFSEIVYRINNTNAQEVLSGISKIYRDCTLFNNLVIRLEENITLPSVYYEFIDVRGRTDKYIVLDLGGFEFKNTSSTFNFINCDIYIKNGWLTFASGATKTGFLSSNSNLIYENVIISNDGGTSGRGACMSTSANSTVTLKDGTIVQGDWGYSTSNVVFRDDGTTQYNYEVALKEGVNIPKRKLLSTNVGGIVINKGDSKYYVGNSEWVLIN